MGLQADIRVEDTYIPDAIINVLHNLRRDHARGFRLDVQVQVRKQRPCQTPDRVLIYHEFLRIPDEAEAIKLWADATFKARGTNPTAQEWLDLPEVKSRLESWLKLRKEQPEYYWVDVRELRRGFNLEQHPGNELKAAYEFVAAMPELSNVRPWPADQH